MGLRSRISVAHAQAVSACKGSLAKSSKTLLEAPRVIGTGDIHGRCSHGYTVRVPISLLKTGPRPPSGNLVGTPLETSPV